MEQNVRVNTGSGGPTSSTAGLATISAYSEDGFTNPVYSAPLPAALAEAGCDQAKWQALLAECNQHVKFEWSLIGVGCLLGVLPGLCCFLCNMQNKGIASKMKAFCDKVNFFFFFTLVTGPKRSLSLKLSDTKSMSLKYEPASVTTTQRFSGFAEIRF